MFFDLSFQFVILHLLISVHTQFHILSCCPLLSSHFLFHHLSWFHSVLTFLRPQFGFSDSFVTVTGCRSVAHHSSWRASTLYPLGKVAQLYPWAPVPISVTFYNPHGLQRDCSFSQSLHRDFTSHIVIIFIYAVSCKYFKYLFCIADVYMFLQKKSFVLK